MATSTAEVNIKYLPHQVRKDNFDMIWKIWFLFEINRKSIILTAETTLTEMENIVSKSLYTLKNKFWSVCEV